MMIIIIIMRFSQNQRENYVVAEMIYCQHNPVSKCNIISDKKKNWKNNKTCLRQLLFF